MAKKETKKKQKKERSILTKANKKGRHINPFLNVLRVLVIPIYYLLKPFRYYGNRKVQDGACVYVSNHYTTFDAAYIAATTWEGIHIVAKKEVFETFGLGLLARGVKAIPVNRDGNDVRALLDCFKCLKNGEKIAVYPEGTRNKTDAEMLEFKHGASVMAIRTKTPIVPVVLYDKPKFFRRAHILIGDPFEFTEYYDRKLTDEDYSEADQKLREMMLQMRRDHKNFLQQEQENKKKKKGKA